MATIGGYDGLIVRSGTTVTKEVIEAGKKLKVIGVRAPSCARARRRARRPLLARRPPRAAPPLTPPARPPSSPLRSVRALASTTLTCRPRRSAASS
jgi:hypothetical protein